MVGDILQDQEAKDREQFVFLTQDDVDMTAAEDKLADPKQIHKLPMGEEQTEEVGPRNEGPRRLLALPHVSFQECANLLGGLTVTEVAQLFDIFRGKTLTRASVLWSVTSLWREARSMTDSPT